MADIAGMQRLTDNRFFPNWDQFVDPDRIAASEASIRRLVDDVISLGSELSEDAARAKVDACVRRFNDLDEEGWICTDEREDIYDQVGQIIDLCGLEYDEDWVAERNW